MESFKKQNYEEFLVAGDCVDVLDTGEELILAGSEVIAYDSEGTVVSGDVLIAPTMALGDSPDGGTNNMLQIRCKDGLEANSPYKITFRMITDQGNRWEVDVRMKIKEL